eukprot:TRINITY_DN2548_c0_g1_i5.p1 TRINITY_DN2548_c0_g1~~TRINITY_DN2548_c0_g1_i5.p1  ORF type:complete len:502 (-),score=132.28 TRINITY_DN2548_c0_g1_i5:173-1678(-)
MSHATPRRSKHAREDEDDDGLSDNEFNAEDYADEVQTTRRLKKSRPTGEKDTKTREKARFFQTEVDAEIDKLIRSGVKLTDEDIENIKSKSELNRNLFIEELLKKHAERKLLDQVKQYAGVKEQAGQKDRSRSKASKIHDDEDHSDDENQDDDYQERDEEHRPSKSKTSRKSTTADMDTDPSSKNDISASQAKDTKTSLEPSQTIEFNLSEANGVLLRREQIKDVIDLSSFRELAIGLWVRILVRQRDNERIYNFAQIVGIKEDVIQYEVEGIPTKLQAEVEHAGFRKWQRLDIISNQDITEAEFAKWKERMNRSRLTFPTAKDVRLTTKQLTLLLDRQRIADERLTKIEENKAKRIVNFAMTVNELRDEISAAESEADYQKAEELKRRLGIVESNYKELKKRAVEATTAHMVNKINQRKETRAMDLATQRGSAKKATTTAEQEKQVLVPIPSMQAESNKNPVPRWRHTAQAILNDHAFELDVEVDALPRYSDIYALLQMK